MAGFSQFLQKVTGFIPVEPVKFPENKEEEVVKLNSRRTRNQAKVVEDKPTKESKIVNKSTKPVEIVNVKVTSTAQPRVSQRNKPALIAVEGNVRDIKNIQISGKSSSRLAEAKPQVSEPQAIESSRPKRAVTMTTKTRLIETKSTETPVKPKILNAPVNIVTPKKSSETFLKVTEPSDAPVLKSETSTPSRRTSTRLITSNSTITSTNTSTKTSNTASPVKSLHSPKPSSVVSTPKSLKIKRSSSLLKQVHAKKTKPTKSEDDEIFEAYESDSEPSEDEFAIVVESVDEPVSKKRSKSESSNKTGSNNTRSKSKNVHSQPQSKSARWDRIKQVLKSGGTIEALPGRIDEFEWIKRTVVGLLESGLGGCLCKLSFI